MRRAESKVYVYNVLVLSYEKFLPFPASGSTHKHPVHILHKSKLAWQLFCYIFASICTLIISFNEISALRFYPSRHLKGTIAWDGFLAAHSIMSLRWLRVRNLLGFCQKFAEIGSVFCRPAYSPCTGKKLLAYSPNILIFFQLAIHASQNTFAVFGDDFV